MLDVQENIIVDAPEKTKEGIEALKNLSFNEFMDQAISGLVKFTIHLAIAIIVFYVGRLLIRKIHAVLTVIFLKRKVDKSLSTFLLSVIQMVLYFILMIIVIGILGIETSSFIALFASAGVAVGMALSGTLQNFAGGVLILLLKPYKIGDYIETQGFAGTVREIQIFHTIINTPDNKAIIIPNGGLSTGSINNYSREKYRRVDWEVSISYGDQVQAARDKILQILAEDERVINKYLAEQAKPEDQDPCEVENPTPEQKEECEAQMRNSNVFSRWFHRKKRKTLELHRLQNEIIKGNGRLDDFLKSDRSPVVYLKTLGDSAVTLTVRAWVRSENYWGVYYSVNERIYNELPSVGINFPFPQMDVHLYPTEDKVIADNQTLNLK